MNKKGKKFISLFLVFSLATLSGNLMAKEAKGAKIAVDKIDGQKVLGELIAVKEDSLVLLDAETDYDVTIPLRDVKTITLRKKSWMFELGVLGALSGAAAQGIIQKTDRRTHGSIAADDDIATHGQTSFLTWAAIAGGAGALIGAVFGVDKKFQMEGKSDAEINEVLETLRKKARVRDYR